MLTNALMNLDITLFHILNSFAGQSVLHDGIIIFFATYLPYLMVAGFALFLVFRRQEAAVQRVRWFSLAVFAALVARLGVVELIRFFIHRARPFVSMDVHQLILLNAPSFPSGHAAFFFAFSTVVFLYHRTLGSFFFLASFLVCAARVAAGVHYPSDILGGIVVGIVSGLLTYYWLNKPLSQLFTFKN